MMLKKKVAAVALAAAPMILLAGCGKPSESKLHDKLVSEVKKATNGQITDEQAEKFADCAAPKLHDQLSASSLDIIIDKGVGSDVRVKAADADKADSINSACISEAMGS